MPHILDIFQKRDGTHYALVTTNALYCGVCRPREDPIKMTELDQ